MFVGDVDTGSLYHFKLNQQRDGLALTGALADKVANTPQESQQVVLGRGFGTITDLQVGPDGYLYVLTFGGTLYRIVPLHPISNNGNNGNEPKSTSTHLQLHPQLTIIIFLPPASISNLHQINNTNRRLQATRVVIIMWE
jgi:hypothetical protein